MSKQSVVLFVVLLLSTISLGRAEAQEGALDAPCHRPEVEFAGAREACLATAQAIVSAQPMLGVLISAGNPTIGTLGGAGLRLGLLPRVSAGARLNTVGVRLPDILADQIPGRTAELAGRLGIPAPAITGDLSIDLVNGINLSPTIGGIGGVSLLGSIGYLPFQLVNAEGFEEAEFGYGLGARIHLLRESFTVPGIAVSVMRHSLPEMAFGDICPSGLLEVPFDDVPSEVAVCEGGGDTGEFTFDLTDWSGRLVASKRLLGFGALLGVGYDSYSSDIGFGFRAPQPIPGTAFTPAYRVTDQELEATRWTVFGNLSFSLLILSIAAEAGWQQGDAPITGFQELEGNFNPRDGAWYGSLGARISL